MTDGTAVTPSVAAASNLYPVFLFGPASSGQCIRGWVVYQVSAGVQPSFLVWEQKQWEPVKWAVD